MKTEGLEHRGIVNLSILLIIAFFCFLSVGLASADSYTYTLSGGPSSETPLVVDDDLEVKVNAKTVFVDDDGYSTLDGRATWKGAPITFSASPGDGLRIIATNPGGVDIELSPLYLHANGQSLKLSSGVPLRKSEIYEFFNESFTISIPSPLVSILDYSPSPVYGGDDLNVKVSWSNIPAGWKLVVSLEESEWNYTRLADDVSKMVSGSGEETFKLRVYLTTETYSEAKVCACFYNEKGELKILDKKPIKVHPPLLVSIISYSPSPVHGGEDLNVNVSWSNIPAGWKLIVSLEESDSNYTRLADDVNISKLVSDSEEETFKLKVYPTTEAHSEAKVCACFYNEKGELKILDKKDIIVYPKTPPPYLYTLLIAIILLLLLPLVVLRKRGKKGIEVATPPKTTLESKTNIKKEDFPPLSKSITIGRAIYDPCKRDFIEGQLPRMKEWINRYDKGAYWFAVSIQNNTNETMEEWSVELETSAALKIEEAKIEGIEIKIPHEAHLGLFKISVPKEYGIVIPKGGTQRVYFKLRADKPKTMYEISGVFKSAITGDMPIRPKEFKYLCDAGVLPEAVKTELKKTFSEKDAARLALSFKTIQELDRMCDREAKTDEYMDKLLVLKNYTEGFSDKFSTHVDEFSRVMKEEQLGYLDDKYKGKVKRFCTNLVDVWISEFLKG